MKPVIIIGAGGHAKVLIEALHLNEVKIIGILEVDPDLIGKQVLGVAVIGSDDTIESYKSTEIELVNGLGAIGLPLRRKILFEKFKNLGFVFTKVIHPSAIIAADISVGEGAQIMAGAIIQPGSKVGCNTIVNTKVSVDHDCIIGDHVHLAPGVTLSGGANIGDVTLVGVGANLVQGVKLGRSVVVGAGALILNDVLDEVTVMGVPAKVSQK